MPRRYWHVILAAIGTLTLAYACPQTRYQAEGKEQQPAAKPTPAVPEAYSPCDYQPAEGKPKSQSGRDLSCDGISAKAATDQAAEAGSGFWVSIAGLVLGGLTLCAAIAAAMYARDAANQTAKSNSISESALEGQLRAWIDFDIGDRAYIQAFDEGVEVVGRVTFENHGNSPALNLTYGASLVMDSDCQSRIDYMINDFSSGYHEFSDKNLFAAKKWVKNITAIYSGPPKITSKLCYVLIARYKTSYSNGYRFTAKAFNVTLLKRDGLGLEVSAGRNVDLANIPPNGIAIAIQERLQFAGVTT